MRYRRPMCCKFPSSNTPYGTPHSGTIVRAVGSSWKPMWWANTCGDSWRRTKICTPTFIKRAVAFGTIEQAISDIRAGKFVLVADDEERENEGDLLCAAELVTPAMINFLLLHARGVICLALTNERADYLRLDPMTDLNTEAMRTAFTTTIDASPRHGVTTGVSATDRATTIRVAVDPAS